ncbi:MAG: nitrite/sulfite reductase [Trichloromonadaceae bacterium]
MTVDYQKLRIEGIYRQNEAGDLMQRVKLPAGVISVEQARKVCDIAEGYSNGRLHLTTRGSVEIHWLRPDHLPATQRMLASVGLTSRGACGGAVRGISCSSSAGPGFSRAQVLAARLQRHFTGNPHFEGLPKKFKLAVESGYADSRHLIQDLALVLVDSDEHGPRYDVWIAGGLGREPREAILYRPQVPEAELLPIIEAVVRIYRSQGEAGKRLKHLLARIGEAQLRQEIQAQVEGAELCSLQDVVAKQALNVDVDGPARIEVAVFAGELSCAELRQLAELAQSYGEGFLLVSADQNLAFYPQTAQNRAALVAVLTSAGFLGEQLHQRVSFRICPGSHECRLGLAPTRDVAEQVLASLGPVGQTLDWAVSGCFNSCAQPQLAAAGIQAVANRPDAEGRRQPQFDFYRRTGTGFGQQVARNLSLEQVLQMTAALG